MVMVTGLQAPDEYMARDVRPSCPEVDRQARGIGHDEQQTQEASGEPTEPDHASMLGGVSGRPVMGPPRVLMKIP
jgi:hypothetical protein